MNLKIQCGCGAKYSFEVEPVNGRMPFAVKCPSCGADGTEAANAMIADAIPTPPAPTPGILVARVAEEASDREKIQQAAQTRMAVEELRRQKKAQADKSHRLKVYLLATVIVAVAAYAGFWAWYYFSGSKPHLIYETTFGSGAGEPSVRFLGPGKFLTVDHQTAVLRDLKAEKDIWTTTISPTGTPGKPRLFLGNGFIWVGLSNEVVQLDAATGAVKRATPIDGTFLSFTPDGANILVVSATDETTRRTMRINIGTGDSSSEDETIPQPAKYISPNELPKGAQPTEEALLAQENDEHAFSKTLDSQDSHFYSSGENLVEMRVSMEEPKIESVQSIRPQATMINGETTASTTLFGVSDEVFNSLKRSRTTGIKQVDESKYGVKVRRWLNGKPVEWTGETIGAPTIFPLKSVDLVAGGKTLFVLDKQNQFLFQANLSYPIADRYVTNRVNQEDMPAVEGPGGFYFFDQGVVTAFALPQGQVLWRITTVGTTKLQFDASGNLYVNTSTASPEDIQYSDSISFDKVKPVVMKVDPRDGRILWQREGLGLDSYLSGKYVYATSANIGGAAITQALKDAMGSGDNGEEASARFHLCRLNPETGQVLWDMYHQGVPDDLAFDENRFVLCYEHDVQAWRTLSF